MALEQFWTYLVELKIPFETRLLIFGVLVLALVLTNLFHFLVKKRETWLGVSAYLQKLETSRFNLPPYKFLTWADGAWRKLLFAEFMFLRRGNLTPYNTLTGLTLGILTIATLFSRPYIISSTPDSDSYMLDAETIVLDFSLPVDLKELSLNVSPDVPGKWDFARTIFNIPLVWKAQFHPEESFFPERKIVVYVVGLKSLWNPAVSHEQAIEFYSPKLPSIISVSPASGSTLVSIDTQVEVEYDSVIGSFIQLDFAVSPKEDLTVVQNDETYQELAFAKPLEQGKKYQLTISRTPVSYKVETKEVLEKGETEAVAKIEFQTVEVPLVASFKPTGEAVSQDAVIKINFKNPLETGSAEGKFSINPYVWGRITWENDNKTFIFTPNTPLPKETSYDVTFDQGLRDIYGGVTTEELKFSFQTIGKVKVKSLYPKNGSGSLDPNKTNIIVVFDQAVNHASAQRKFSLTPYVSGKFVWDKNRLIYAVAGKLSYNKTYTVKLAAGIKSVAGLDSKQTYSSTFSTRSKTVLLSVPQYYQNPSTQTFNCNLVAAQMALAYRGINVGQEAIKSAIGIGQNPNTRWVDGYGVHTPPISSYLTSRGISNSVKTGWNLSALAKEIEKGNPVILWWYNRYSQPKGAVTLSGGYKGYRGMHSEVVRGFTGSSDYPTSIMTNDPWRGQLTYDRALFLSTWSYLNYTAIVVYK